MDDHPAIDAEPANLIKPNKPSVFKLAAGGLGIILASVLAGTAVGFGYTQWLHTMRDMGGWGFALIIYLYIGAGAGLVVGLLLAFIWGLALWVRD